MRFIYDEEIMVAFIINTIIILFSFALLTFDYFYIKNEAKDLENRIKRFVFGGIEVLLIGIAIIALTLLGAKIPEIDIVIETYLLVIFVIISLGIYIGLLFLWNVLYKILQKQFFKKQLPTKYRFKSISIYGLIYCFGILFYLIYSIQVFEGSFLFFFYFNNFDINKNTI